MSKENTLYTFSDILGLSNESIERHGIYLYHGIRFDTINRLESIFQTGYILPGNKVKDEFLSYDGNIKYLYIDSDDLENCNMGKYISVMPEEDSLEFDVFVRENLFFAIKGSIRAYKTKHISYDEYCKLRDNNESEIYSYAFNEYFVEDDISLEDVIFIGIDSINFNGNYDKIIEDIVGLIKYYKIDIPLIDISNYNEVYRLNNKQFKKENYKWKKSI